MNDFKIQAQLDKAKIKHKIIRKHKTVIVIAAQGFYSDVWSILSGQIKDLKVLGPDTINGELAIRYRLKLR